MQKLIKILCLAVILLANTSCFEILEEINVKKDGSGTASVKIDLSASKDNLAGYMEMDEVRGIRVPKKAEIDREIARVKDIIASVEGMSNIETSMDYEHFILRLSGNFKNLTAVNLAINTAAEALNKSPYPTVKEDNFLLEDKMFYRLFNYPINTKLYEKLGTMERFVLESAKMVSIFRFEDNILDFSNRDARMSPNLTAILMESTIADLIKGTKTIENTIELE